MRRFVCAGCGKEVERAVRTQRDGGKYCSRACCFNDPNWRPALYRANREAKRKARVPRTFQASCPTCGRSFITSITNPAVMCSRTCVHTSRVGVKVNGPLYEHACGDCGSTFSTQRRKGNRCRLCRKRYIQRVKQAVKRARRMDARRESIDPLMVFTRDKWTCQLCGCATPKKLRGKHVSSSPEIDHILPLSRGGSHTWDNVQCSCRACNQSKHARFLGQLRLSLSAAAG
jgi:5-methylcytosine-specific restriction endonuclease McrA